MEHSLVLLRDSEMKISYISTRVGFHEESHFSKVFKKYYGMSPKKYRSELLV